MLQTQPAHRIFKRLSVTVLGFLGLFLLTFHVAMAQTSDITVCAKNGDFTTIQAAIDAAHVGGTIFICSATYFENLHLDKSLTLRGESQTASILDGGQPLTPVISIQPGITVKIADLTMKGGVSVEKKINMTSPNTTIHLITGSLADLPTLTTAQEGDLVTTTINGDISGNVSIIQANTKVYVENVSMLCSEQITRRTISSHILMAAPVDGKFVFDRDTGDISIQPLDALCNLEAPLDQAGVAGTNAAPVDPFASNGNLTLQGSDQVTTTINGNISGNAVIIQANTRVYVENLSQPSSDNKAFDLAALPVAAFIDTASNSALQTGDQVTTIVNGNVIGNLVILQANTTVAVTNMTLLPSSTLDQLQDLRTFLPVIKVEPNQ